MGVEAITGLTKLELPAYRRMMASEDFFEGPKVFSEKRDARFKNR
ncbi:MAG: hypothetical protein ACKVSF_15970 [Alphaproteobacteria bacterium]